MSKVEPEEEEPKPEVPKEETTNKGKEKKPAKSRSLERQPDPPTRQRTRSESLPRKQPVSIYYSHHLYYRSGDYRVNQ